MTSIVLSSIVRYVRVSESLATAGQPSEEQLAAVAAAGFEVVVNLALHDDPRYSLRNEAATVTSLGLEYIHIPVQFSSPSASHLAAFFEAMERAIPALVLLHHTWPGYSIASLLARIRKKSTNVRVVVFTGRELNLPEVVECVRNGVCDYWLVSSPVK